MGIIKAIGALTLFVVLGLVGFWAYLGGFSSVVFEEQPYGPVEIAYTTHLGSYAKISESWNRFETEWNDAGIDGKRCDSLAVYLNSPDETEPENLQSILACRLDTALAEDAENFRKAFPVFTIPQVSALRTEFPFKNFLSFMVGPMKVYPAAEKRMKQDALEASIAIELYGPGEKPDRIGIVIPVDHDKSEFDALREAFE
ncbi:MAG: hypothetical protein AAGD92_13715 [Pseudomonadota bacterium]